MLRIEKNVIQSWWNREACGSQFATAEKFSAQYFAEIEEKRYRLEPYIHSFAQFTCFRGKKVLEVGVGAGTDFVQWIRSGAVAYGVDLTTEAILHTSRRLELESLQAVDLCLGDVEHLNYPDDFFDLVYSWGVIHHTSNPNQALSEIVRVTSRGGRIKIMLYHRHSVAAFMTWFRRCALRGRPWLTISYAVANYVESPGTQSYTRREVTAMLKALELEDIEVRTVLTWCDLATMSRSALVRTAHHILSWLGGKDRVGWFMLISARKRIH